jgi:hypothetical protein
VFVNLKVDSPQLSGALLDQGVHEDVFDLLPVLNLFVGADEVGVDAEEQLALDTLADDARFS